MNQQPASEIRIPSVEECLRTMRRHGMMPNIRRHSLLVARVAVIMGEALNGEERCLNIPLIVAGALLHDIAKTQSLQAGGDHVEMGRRIVLQMGYPEVASIVARHVDSGPEILDTIDEATIVNYSDKRVQHDRVVSLRERLKDLLTRYGKSPEKSARLQEMMRNIEALERAILSEVSLSADELEAMIRGVPQGPLLEESALKDFATQKSRTRGT